MKITFTLLVLTFSSLLLKAQTHLVSAVLSGANEVPSVTTEASGTLSGTYDTTSNAIVLTVSYTGLTESLTASHLHAAPAGSNGGIIVNLAPSTGSSSGSFSGTYGVPQVNEAALLAEGVYINLHSSTYGGGELRAQLILEPIPESQCEVEVAFGDLCIKDSERGVVLKSPGGDCFRVQVGDDGTLQTSQVTCP